MGLFEHFPYTNFHDMNTDWLVKVAKEFMDKYTTLEQTIDEGTEGLNELAETLEGQLNQWYTTHSEDIADELATSLEAIRDATTDAEESIDESTTQIMADFLDTLPPDYVALTDEVEYGVHVAYPQFINGVTGVMSHLAKVIRGKRYDSPQTGIVDDLNSNILCFETGFGWITGEANNGAGHARMNKQTEELTGWGSGTLNLAGLESAYYAIVNESDFDYLDLDYISDGMPKYAKRTYDNIPVTNFSAYGSYGSVDSYGGTDKAFAPFRMTGTLDVTGASKAGIYNPSTGVYETTVTTFPITVNDKIVIVFSTTPADVVITVNGGGSPVQEGAVLYNQSQTLTDMQKNTAKTNIGANYDSAISELQTTAVELSEDVETLQDDTSDLKNTISSLSNGESVFNFTEYSVLGSPTITKIDNNISIATTNTFNGAIYAIPVFKNLDYVLRINVFVGSGNYYIKVGTTPINSDILADLQGNEKNYNIEFNTGTADTIYVQLSSGNWNGSSSIHFNNIEFVPVDYIKKFNTYVPTDAGWKELPAPSYYLNANLQLIGAEWSKIGRKYTITIPTTTASYSGQIYGTCAFPVKNLFGYGNKLRVTYRQGTGVTGWQWNEIHLSKLPAQWGGSNNLATLQAPMNVLEQTIYYDLDSFNIDTTQLTEVYLVFGLLLMDISSGLAGDTLSVQIEVIPSDTIVIATETVKDIANTDILFWGDSLTVGAGGNGTNFPKVCADTLGKKHINCGVGGETANTISARQGGNDVIIPAGNVNGTYQTLTDIFGSSIAPLIQGNGNNTGNKLIINNIECSLAYANNAYTISGYTGSAITVPTIARFIGSKFKGNMTVIFVGQNGAYCNGVVNNVDARIAIIDSMIKHLHNNDYIIMGLTSGTNESRNADDSAMLAHYGNKFFPTRTLLVNYGLTINGITPTAQDTTDINNGTVPTSLRSDDTHMNAYGYTAIGKLLADWIRGIGYIK